MALTKAHSRMIEGSAVNVVDFGAVGDGVTDDTAAYRSALAVYYENLDVNPAADLQLIVEIAGNTTTGVFKFARDVSAGQNVAASLTATSVIVVQGSYRV